MMLIILKLTLKMPLPPDPDNPEYVRELRRPAEVKEDVRGMTDRKRVTAILKSQAFREELEQLVQEQIQSGPHPASLIALQQISELILPQARGSASAFARGGKYAVILINNIKMLKGAVHTPVAIILRDLMGKRAV